MVSGLLDAERARRTRHGVQPWRPVARGLRGGSPLVPVVQAADARVRHDRGFSLGPTLRRPPRGCRLPEAQVGPIIVVVGDVLAEEAPEVVFAEHDDVVEQFAADAADPALGDAVLPGTAVGGPPRLDAEGLDRRDDGRPNLPSSRERRP